MLPERPSLCVWSAQDHASKLAGLCQSSCVFSRWFILTRGAITRLIRWFTSKVYEGPGSNRFPPKHLRTSFDAPVDLISGKRLAFPHKWIRGWRQGQASRRDRSGCSRPAGSTIGETPAVRLPASRTRSRGGSGCAVDVSAGAIGNEIWGERVKKMAHSDDMGKRGSSAEARTGAADGVAREVRISVSAKSSTQQDRSISDGPWRAGGAAADRRVRLRGPHLEVAESRRRFGHWTSRPAGSGS